MKATHLAQEHRATTATPQVDDFASLDAVFACYNDRSTNVTGSEPSPTSAAVVPAEAILLPAAPQCTPAPQPYRTPTVERFGWRRTTFRLLSIACFLVAAIWLYRALPGTWKGSAGSAPVREQLNRRNSGDLHHAARSASPRTKTIEQVDIFDRVLGTNPLLSDQERNIPEPDPATWRVLRLQMTKESGKLLHIKLARPLTWIDKVIARPGETFFLELPEMGAVGDAQVLAVEACPPLKPGSGNIVTGTFAHEADDNLVTLQLSNGIPPIGVTNNHPFWSEDRQDFVHVGQLRRGERVRTQTGTAEVISLTKRPIKPGEKVYNLEVHGEHVYQVTYAGVLVHNTCGIVWDPRANRWRDTTTGRFTTNPSGDRAVRSLERRIAEHQQKLEEFRRNPTPRPGTENLSPEIQRRSIEGRIRHLENEITTFQENIQKILRGEL